MKILLIGEYSNVHWTLAEGLRQLGHTVTVISNGDYWKNYNRDMGMDVSKLELKQLDPIPCLRYANMERDLRILLDDFMDWIDYRNLYELINDIKETPCSNHKQ